MLLLPTLNTNKPITAMITVSMWKLLSRLCVLSAFLFHFHNPVFGQETIRPEINPIPPSPEATAINKFIDFPVNYHTGVPDISIPLYTLEMPGMSLPISLDYHAGGLRVEEVASRVGAGWKLNAGGVITRTIRGLPDEKYSPETQLASEQRGLFHTTYVPNLYLANGELNWVYLNSCDPSIEGATTKPMDPIEHLGMGAWDLEPDIYQVSLPGASTKFFFDKDRNLRKLQSDDIRFQYYPFGLNNIDTTYINQNFDPTNRDYRFVLHDDRGIVYKYQDPERTTVTSGCFPQPPYDYGGVSRRQNAWFLSTMQLNDDRRFDFSYDDRGISYDSRYYTTEKFKLTVTNDGSSNTSNICLNHDLVETKELRTITSTNGYRVDFIPGDASRLDLNGSRAVEMIVVTRGMDTIKVIDLVYSYFGANDKLKLEEVRFLQPGDYSSYKKYDLVYHAGTFPSLQSKKQDHWGYYNGAAANEFNMIPSWKNEDFHVNVNSPADREPNLQYAKIGTLKRLIYPTGGYAEFEYELNDFYDPNYMDDIILSVSASGGSELYQIDSTRQFSITQNTRATVISDNPADGLDALARLQKFNPSNGQYVAYAGISTPGNRIILEPGDYRLIASSMGGSASITVEYEENNNKKYHTVGGLRIKRIEYYDPIKQQSIYKHFEYTEDALGEKRSSGKLYTDPRTYGYLTTYLPGDLINGQCQFSGETVVSANLSHNSQVPLATSQGSAVGYSEVKVYNLSSDYNGARNLGEVPFNASLPESMKNNGFKRLTFQNDLPAPVDRSLPSVPSEDLNFKNGKLRKEEVFANAGDASFYKLSESDISYELAVDETLEQVQVFKIWDNSFCYICNDGTNSSKAVSNMYELKRRWYREKLRFQYQYEPGSSDTLKSITETFYSDFHFKPRRIETENWDGVKQSINYGRHSFRPAIVHKIERYEEGQQVSGEKVIYNYTTPTAYYEWVRDKNEFLQRNLIVRDELGYPTELYDNRNLALAATDTTEGDSLSLHVVGSSELTPGSFVIYTHGASRKVAAVLTGLTKAEYEALLQTKSPPLPTETNFQEIRNRLLAMRSELGTGQQMQIFLYDPEKGGEFGPTEIIDENGTSNYFRYDAAGRLIRQSDFQHNLTSFFQYNLLNK